MHHMKLTKKNKHLAKMIDDLLRSAEETRGLASSLEEMRNGEWELDLSVTDGELKLKLFGPDCDVWAERTFRKTIQEWLDHIEWVGAEDEKTLARVWAACAELEGLLIEIEKEAG